VAELIRQGVDQMSQKQGHPDQKHLRQKAMQAAGKLSGPSDLSKKHDDYLAEIY
jgi:Arc/MetJ-type ribon-helix-helix transcriptional regulator